MRKTILIACTAVFVCCLGGIAAIFADRLREDRVDSSVAALVTLPASAAPSPAPTEKPAAPTAVPEITPATPTPEPQVLEKYAALYAQNPDIIGWLRIDGTAIDYAVMQTPDDPDKYLHIDFYGDYSNRGTLYMDAKCDIRSSDNLIIYGHHMKSSAMFGHLDYYADKAYWEDHPYIQFDTIYEEQTYEVVAAFYARILYKDEEGFRYYQFIDARNEADFDAYVDFINENACYDTGVGIAYGDGLLTLSTCAYQTENGRFAVVAKKITEDAPAESARPDGGAPAPGQTS